MNLQAARFLPREEPLGLDTLGSVFAVSELGDSGLAAMRQKKLISASRRLLVQRQPEFARYPETYTV